MVCVYGRKHLGACQESWSVSPLGAGRACAVTGSGTLQAMRIVSLVPNGTEILFALGAGDEVVGVSHECDFPEEARQRPVLTGSPLPPGLAAAEVDRPVSAPVGRGASPYTVA